MNAYNETLDAAIDRMIEVEHLSPTNETPSLGAACLKYALDDPDWISDGTHAEDWRQIAGWFRDHGGESSYVVADLTAAMIFPESGPEIGGVRAFADCSVQVILVAHFGPEITGGKHLAVYDAEVLG